VLFLHARHFVGAKDIVKVYVFEIPDVACTIHGFRRWLCLIINLVE
jgi:hypothetical protein